MRSGRSADRVGAGRPIYDGRVTSVKDFGAFVEILPGKDGLCHISELSDGYVNSVGDVCKVGDEMQVKVIAIDDQDRVKLSRKQAMRELDKADASGQQSRTAEARAARRMCRHVTIVRGLLAAAGGRRSAAGRLLVHAAQLDFRRRTCRHVHRCTSPHPPTADEVNQRLVEQYTEIATLAGGLAHEIKNPLSTIRLNMELLAEDFADAEHAARPPGAGQDRASCSANASGCRTLLDDFLNFAKLRHAAARAVGPERAGHAAARFLPPQGRGGAASK